MSPRFLELAEIVAIHHDQLHRYGGIAGVRDVGLLQSATAMPAASFSGQYLHADLFEMAAAYLFHLALNHPFLDGNKRVGAVAADIFLQLNGFDLVADPLEFYELVMSVARGEATKAVAAEFFRTNCRSR
jgi:death on curing protein